MVKKKNELSWFTKIEGLLGLAFIPYNILKNRLLSSSKAKTRAVIINEENYFGNNTRRFSYSYRFYQNGQAYTGNPLNSQFQVGDSVWVKYVPSFPRFNRIMEPEE
jgi:hypothetical protein